MKDTDWRPSVCPSCGKLRSAAQYPVCENKNCIDYGLYTGVGMNKEERTMTIKRLETKPRYLWVRPNSAESPLVFVDDPMELFRGSQFDESVDKLYMIGGEVKFKLTLEPVPNHRSSESGSTSIRNL